jgi:hypothetical protein
VREPLLVAHLHARQVEHAVLHGAGDALALARHGAVVERRDDAERQVQAGAGIADLRAGDERGSLAEAGGGGGAARALGHVLVHLAIFVGAGAEALDRGIDHARVELMDALPGEPHAIERARSEVLHQHIARFHQPLEDLHSLLVLAIDGDGALVVVQHREIERIRTLHVLQLAARDVADAGALDLDHVGAEPGEQLRARRTRLHVGEVEDLDAF